MLAVLIVGDDAAVAAAVADAAFVVVGVKAFGFVVAGGASSPGDMLDVALTAWRRDLRYWCWACENIS